MFFFSLNIFSDKLQWRERKRDFFYFLNFKIEIRKYSPSINGFANLLQMLLHHQDIKANGLGRRTTLCLRPAICSSPFQLVLHVSLWRLQNTENEWLIPSSTERKTVTTSFLRPNWPSRAWRTVGTKRPATGAPAFPVASFNKIISQQLQAFNTEM